MFSDIPIHGAINSTDLGQGMSLQVGLKKNGSDPLDINPYRVGTSAGFNDLISYFGDNRQGMAAILLMMKHRKLSHAKLMDFVQAEMERSRENTFENMRAQSEVAMANRTSSTNINKFAGQFRLMEKIQMALSS